MLDVAFRQAWMQKHPSPVNRTGDFHWCPAELPPAVCSALTELASTAGRNAAVWIVDPAFIAWARPFTAVSPIDRRRYTGLAATIAQPRKGAEGWPHVLAEVLERLPLPAATPLTGEPPEIERSAVAPGLEVWPIDTEALRAAFPDLEALARAVLRGGHAPATDPLAAELPRHLGRLLSWLPASERDRPRRGVFGRRAAEPATDTDTDANLVHYLAAAWACPEAIRARDPLFAGRAWQLVLDLTDGGARSLSAVFDALTDTAAAWDTAEQLRDWLRRSGTLRDDEITACDRRAPSALFAEGVPDAGWQWNRLLHYWGRGLCGDASLGRRLARLLALRVTADHLFHLDAPQHDGLPTRYLRRLRYEALLAAPKVALMTDELRHILPSLPAGGAP